MDRMRYAEIGKIVAVHGIKGEVRVLPLTDNPRRFDTGQRLFARQGQEHASLTIDESRRTNKGVLVKFKELHTRSDAERLGKASLEIPETERRPLGEDEYWVDELIGLHVYTTDGRSLGELTGIMETGGNDVYSVEKDDREVLLPATKEVVKSVDIAHKRMVVEPLPGLLD